MKHRKWKEHHWALGQLQPCKWSPQKRLDGGAGINFGWHMGKMFLNLRGGNINLIISTNAEYVKYEEDHTKAYHNQIAQNQW